MCFSLQNICFLHYHHYHVQIDLQWFTVLWHSPPFLFFWPNELLVGFQQLFSFINIAILQQVCWWLLVCVGTEHGYAMQRCKMNKQKLKFRWSNHKKAWKVDESWEQPMGNGWILLSFILRKTILILINISTLRQGTVMKKYDKTKPTMEGTAPMIQSQRQSNSFMLGSSNLGWAPEGAV